MSNNLAQEDSLSKHQAMYSSDQNCLHEATSVHNLESFNLDKHLDMNRYDSINFGIANNSSDPSNHEVILFLFSKESKANFLTLFTCFCLLLLFTPYESNCRA